MRIPKSMERCVRDSEKTPEMYSLTVRLSHKDMDLMNSNPTFLVKHTERGEVLIYQAKTSRRDKKILFKINSKEWLRRHLIRYE